MSFSFFGDTIHSCCCWKARSHTDKTMIANRCESSNRVTEDNQKSNWTQLVINAIIFPRRHFGQTNFSKEDQKFGIT